MADVIPFTAATNSDSPEGDGDEEGPLPCWGTFDYGGGLREVEIIKQIEEYLAYHHLGESLAAFKRDVERAGLKHTPSQACLSAARDVDAVLLDFDEGREDDFIAGWERVMPEEFRKGHNGGSLELRLRAHFATFRARKTLESGDEPCIVELRADLERFRAFLGERGMDEVCGDEALMPLFALPFVQRPHAQPQVGDVFTMRWLQSLRSDVSAALCSRQPPRPLLYEVMEQTPSVQAGTDSWQAVWAELFRVADASVDAAARKAIGSTVPAAPIAEGRRRLNFLREHIPGGFELRLAGSMDASPSRGIRSRAATAAPRMPRNIDFRRLALFIGEQGEERRFGNVSSKTPSLDAVLRALLQRLASTESPVSQRRGFLVSVACFDVLGIHSNPETMPALLADAAVTELTLGILAVLACEAIGRTYVVTNLACVEKVVELLKTQTVDSSLHIQALAALQRLSLRRGPQDRMIQLGLLEWVVQVVLGYHEESIQCMPSEFSLEFGSALLMNLALRSAGKKKCVELDTLTVALNLMEHMNPQIRTHINGTLYSLLSEPVFRARARHAGLEGVLKSIHSHAASLGDEISRRQIEYLLGQLNPAQGGEAANEEDAESGEDDEDDDENFLEEEELASVLLGDRSGQSASEALRGFAVTPAVAEAQHVEFQAFLTKSRNTG